ncbi:BamA/TamA family outer membrane protein [Flavobacterium alvei]|uniref:BamA/TamA family outer membrane protein n=1 Tax=Flavobacterium alvei TaxID=2080416 RepID=UPI0026EC7183|nr:BamA/TamA family outer membrane protein [Flavobacterium alvei]
MNTKTILEAKSICFLLIFLFYFQLSFSQEESEKKQPLRSILDLFTKEDTLKIKLPKTKTKLIAFPTLGYQPANGFTLGFIGQYSFKEKEENKISLISGGASFSTKKQLLTYLKNYMYLDDDRYFFSGDFRYYIFSQSNYGLGTDIVPWGTEFKDFDYKSIEQPMNYNYFKFHETISFNIFPSFFIGTGIHIDSYNNINDKLLDVSQEKYTYHYNYSKKHGFSDKNYAVNGLSMNLIYDTRDNLINTNNGLYLNLNYRYNPKLFKGQQKSSSLLLESRYFIPISKRNKQHVIGFWAYNQFVTSGHLPYLNLPAIGWDQNSRSGKGYIQGLFRGNNLMFFESEYRFPITKNQMISGTVFANATTASDANKNLRLFESIQPAVGIGLRFLLDKNTLTNFVVNYGLGRDSQTFYFNDGEGF